MQQMYYYYLLVTLAKQPDQFPIDEMSDHFFTVQVVKAKPFLLKYCTFWQLAIFTCYFWFLNYQLVSNGPLSNQLILNYGINCKHFE